MREKGKGELQLRVDLLNLKYGSELNDLDLYVLIGFGEGGSLQFPDNLGKSKIPWKVAVKSYEGEKALVVDQKGNLLGEAEVSYNAQLDTVTISLPENLLRKAGWRGEKLRFQVATAKDMAGKIDDTLTADEDDHVLPLNLAFVFHGNQPIMRKSVIEEKVDNPKDHTGFKRLLETVEKYQIPVEIHMSGLLQTNFLWSVPYFLKKIKELERKGLLTIEGGTWGEHLLPYFEGSGVNKRSLEIGKKLVENLTGKNPKVAWTPERVIDGISLKEIKESGYQATIADYPAMWFKNVSNNPFKDTVLNYKIHELTSLPGFKIFFIDHVFQRETATNSDGGPSEKLRRHFVEQAVDLNEKKDPHRILISMNDWEFVAGFPFGQNNVPSLPTNFEKNVRWIKAHPWLKLTTPTKVLSQNWQTIKHEVDYRSLKPQTYLQEDYHHLMDLLKRWYEGSKEDESYRHWIPLDRGWDFGGFKDQIKTKKELGDVFRKGTILGDIWEGISKAPESQVKHLALLSFLTYIYETAWHDWNVDPKTGKRRISGWERDMAGQIRQIGVLLEATKWLDNVRKGKISPQGRVELRDLNMDGDQEGILYNDKVFLVVSPVGGKVVFAAAYDPKLKDAIPLLGSFLNFPTNEGEAQVNPYLKRIDPKLASHKLSSFTDVPKNPSYPMEDELFNLRLENGKLIAESKDLRKEFTLASSKLRVNYSLKNDNLGEVLIGASPNTLDLVFNGRENLLVERKGKSLIVRNKKGGSVEVRVEGGELKLPENDIPLLREIGIEPLDKSFSVTLNLTPN